MPLSNEIEGGSDKRHPHPKGVGKLVGHFFKMTHQRQHRQQHGFDNHAGVPRAAGTNLHIAGIARLAMPSNVDQHNCLIGQSRDHRSKSLIGDTGQVAVQRDKQAQMIKHKAQLGPDCSPLCPQPCDHRRGRHDDVRQKRGVLVDLNRASSKGACTDEIAIGETCRDIIAELCLADGPTILGIEPDHTAAGA